MVTRFVTFLKMNWLSIYNKRVCLSLVILQTFLAIGFYLYYGGIADASDAGRYIDGAERLVEALPLEDRQFSYISYILVVVVSKLLGLPLIWVVFFQWALSAFALVLIYKLSCRFAQFPANIFGPIIFLFTDIQRWNQTLLSDSVYISCAVILIYLLDKIFNSKFSWASVLFTVIFGVFTVFIRPNGLTYILLIPTTLLLIPRTPIQKRLIVFLICSCLILICLFYVSSHSNGKQSFLSWDTVSLGEVIYNYPEGRISMPVSSSDLRGISGLINYILTYPFSYLKLFLLRIFTELSHYRVFYSIAHNGVSLIVVFVSYLFTSIGLFHYRKLFLARVTFAACFLHSCLIGVTFADWDGRFLMHFFPLLLPFVSAGFSIVLEKIRSRKIA